MTWHKKARAGIYNINALIPDARRAVLVGDLTAFMHTMTKIRQQADNASWEAYIKQMEVST